MQGTNPPCRKLNLKADDGKRGLYVADADIANLSPCLWGGRNPVSGKRVGGCASGFQNMNDIMVGLKDKFDEIDNSSNPLAKVYNIGFSALLVYLMYHLIMKSSD